MPLKTTKVKKKCVWMIIYSVRNKFIWLPFEFYSSKEKVIKRVAELKNSKEQFANFEFLFEKRTIQ